MRFSFDKKEVLEVLSKIQGITGRRTNLSITSDVLIKTMEDRIVLTANDLETVFTGTYDAAVEKEGIISINSKKFYEIVREYPDNTIPVNEVENRWVEIGKGDSMFHIVSSDYENFPETPVIEDVDFIEIDARNLRYMLESAGVITYAGDEKRTYVLGALIEKVEKNDVPHLRMVSTDSRRLNCFDATYTGDLTLPDEPVLIPKKGLSELYKFIDNTSEPIRVGIKSNHFVFQRADESIMIKLLSGDYPNYQPIIQTDTMTGMEVDRSMFYTLMKRVSILTSDDYKTVILHFRDNELTVTITNPEIGEFKERMMIGYSGDEIKSAFNPRYFMDALNLFDQATVLLYIKEARTPCIIKAMDDDNLICAIMAMHIS